MQTDEITGDFDWRKLYHPQVFILETKERPSGVVISVQADVTHITTENPNFPWCLTTYRWIGEKNFTREEDQLSHSVLTP